MAKIIQFRTRTPPPEPGMNQPADGLRHASALRPQQTAVLAGRVSALTITNDGVSTCRGRSSWMRTRTRTSAPSWNQKVAKEDRRRRR